MTWPPHQITWHATSQLTTVAHPTSPHNHPHSFISPRKQLHDIRAGHITTMEQQKARSQQRNGLGIALVGRLAHIIYRQIPSLLYSFFLLKPPPLARPGTVWIFFHMHNIYIYIFFIYIYYIIWYFILYSFNTTSGLLVVARNHNAVSLVRPIRLKVIATPRILIFAAPVICIQRSFCFSDHVRSLALKFCTMLQAYVDIRWCALPQYWRFFRSHVSRCFSGVFDIAEVLPATLNASEKHHVAVFSPILDPNSIQYVHHMILYECSNEAWDTLMDPGKTWRSKQTGKTLTRGNLMMGHGSGGYWFFESCRIHVAC